MSENSAVEPIRGTVFVGRKISDGNYGSFEFGLHFPVEFAQDAPAVEQTDAVVAAFETAQQLVAARTAPIIVQVGEVAAKPAAKPSGGKAISKELRSGQVTRKCKDCGEDTPHWDNRESKRNPKAPDFKCTVCGAGIWGSKKGTDADKADEPF